MVLSLTSSANEENTFNINDLWVSAAVAQDTAVFDDEDEADLDEDNEALDVTPSHSLLPTPGSDRENSVSRRRNRLASSGQGVFRSMASHRLSVSQGGRRFSTSSGQMPAIFSNTGLATQPLALPEDSPGVTSPSDPFFPAQAGRGGLSVIAERPLANEASPLISPVIEMNERPITTWKALPLMMIFQVSHRLRSPDVSTASSLCTEPFTIRCSYLSLSRKSAYLRR